MSQPTQMYTMAREREREREKEREREERERKKEREKREREYRRTYNRERAVKPVKVPGAILVMLLLDKSLCFIHKS